MEKNKTVKNETFQLWWHDQQTNKYYPAGVAFHVEQFGEYRLKIDMHPENQYYLKPMDSTNGSINFGVEVVIKRNGKFHQRRPIGEGFSSQETKGDIVMTLGPYTRKLLLGAKQ
jgi:hypothetical protein